MPTIEFQPTMQTPRSLRLIRPNVSIGDVARGTGLSASNLSRIMNGKRTPRMDTAITICRYLGCTVDDLLAAVAESTAVADSRLRVA
jgi:DNA-binding Xre family transcriptional regulator